MKGLTHVHGIETILEIHGDKSMRYMVATLKNGKSYEVDDSDDGGESLQIDPEMLRQVLAAED